MKQRIEYIDLAKGICILLVVFLHCTSDGGGFPLLEKKLCTFRMPLYFILSGLFFKEYGGTLNFIIKKTNKLLIPFLTFYFFIGILMSCTYDVYLHNDSHLKDPSYYFSFYYEHFNNMPNAIWFLLCLFVVNLIFYIIFHISQKYSIMSIIICVVSLMFGSIGYFLGASHINLPMWLDTSFTVIPFFCFGYMLKHKTNFLYPNKADRYSLWIFILCLCIVFFLGDKVSYIDNSFHIAFPSVYICGIAGSIAVLIIAKVIKYIPIISYLGRYSIIVLIVHHPIIKILNDFVLWRMPWHGGYDFLKFLIVTFLSFVMIPLLKRYAPYVTAQKDLIRTNTLMET